MENTKEFKVLLNETLFTQIIKVGRFTYILNSEGSKIEFPLTSFDVRELSAGKILMRKIEDYIFQITLNGLDKETIREILRRSPLYSSIAEEII